MAKHPKQPPDPTPEEIAERAAIVRAESMARKRKTAQGHATKDIHERFHALPARVCRLQIASNGDRM